MTANAYAGRDPDTYNRDLKHKEIWKGVVQRCTNPNYPDWRNYGGRGVTLCDRWNPKVGGSYENFIADMGYRPSPKHHLDKEAVDRNNKVYCSEMCRWEHRSLNLSSERKRPPRKSIRKSVKPDPRMYNPYPEDADPCLPDPRLRIN